MVSKYIHHFVQFIEQYKNHQTHHQGQGSVVVAHELTRKAAVLYEKIRGFIDYQDENQLKRRLIERIIKRKSRFHTSETLGRTIIEELVGIGYLPNNAVEESKSLEVQHIVDYYATLATVNRDNGKFKNWTMSMAAVAVYELLFDRSHDLAAVSMFVLILKDVITLDIDISEERKEELLLICAHIVLLESSNEEIYYALWSRELTKRKQQADHTDSSYFVLSSYRHGTEILEDKIIFSLITKIKDIGVSVKLLKEYAKEYHAEDIESFVDKHRVETTLSSHLNSIYEKGKTYVKKNGVRAVIYLLCTKIVLALVIEVPLDLWLEDKIAVVALMINIIFHPLLLLYITRRPLGFTSENSHKAIGKALGVIDGHIDPIHIKLKTQSRYEMMYFFLYGLLYAVTFGVIVGTLFALHFNMVSIALFLVFLALVSYFGVRIRGYALKYKVHTGGEGVISTFGNLFMIPVVRLGRYLSTKFSSINALVFIMDFIIETPFKLVLKVFNDFLYFLRDKREDVF
jgi:hypothetical protein